MNQGYIRVYIIFIFIFNNMHILYPETVATSKHSTGVVRLVNIFKDNSNMPCSFFRNIIKTLYPVAGDKFTKEFIQFTFLTICEHLIHQMPFDFDIKLASRYRMRAPTFASHSSSPGETSLRSKPIIFFPADTIFSKR